MEHFTRDLTEIIARNTIQLENMDLAVYNDNSVMICFVRKNMRTPSFFQVYRVEGCLETFNNEKTDKWMEYSKPFICKSKGKLTTLISQIVEDTYWDDGILETYAGLNFVYREGFKEFPPMIKDDDCDMKFSRSVWEELSSNGMNTDITNEIVNNVMRYLEM